MQEENDKIIESWSPLLNLCVPLSVELGQTQMKIRELLELHPSSIVKLQRSTGEGVDIRSDDRSLLRGEVIVIENRAGIRISEIVVKENK